MSGVNIETIDQNTSRFTFANGSLNVLIRHGDISAEPCEAIVNPTNLSMTPNGGLDSIIHQSMGQFFTDQVVAIHQDQQGNACPTGQSRIFVAKFNREGSVTRFIINTVGPVFTKDEEERAAFLLQSCYYTSLALANLYQLSSIAYPAISCGANHFPPHEAARVGIESIRQFSYNVKDVRFILFDRHMYDVFVQEWTDYAQKVNKDANVIDETDTEVRERIRTPPPVSSKSSIRYCVLCKEKTLPRDRQLLCVSCSELTRSEIFIKYLQRLRSAAEKSFDDLQQECQLLEPILTSYPLAYIPSQIFDQSIHKRDGIAEYYLQIHCDKSFRNAMPMAILGDGNCFYNTFVKLGGVGTTTEASTVTAVELRARNVVELVLNVKAYQDKYRNLSVLLDDFQKYVREEMVHDTTYVSVWDLLSIPTVLNINVISVYPKVNGNSDTYYEKLNSAAFIPLMNGDTTDDNPLRTEAAATARDVKILFSNCNKMANTGKKKDWLPNHFVPLLNLR